MYRSDSPDSFAYETNPVLTLIMVDPSKRQYQKDYPHQLFISKTPKIVDNEVLLLRVEPVVLWTDASEKSWGAYLNTRQVARVGNERQGKNYINSFSARSASTSCQRRKSSSQVQQFHNSGIHQQSRGNKVPLSLSVDMGSVPIGSKLLYFPLCFLTFPERRTFLADWLSKGQLGAQLTEWSLDQRIVDLIFKSSIVQT